MTSTTQRPKSLLVLRHGKSDWEAPHESDHERPLNKRGRRAAKIIGSFIAQTDQIPDKILSSSAVRAKTTAELAETAGRWNRTIECDRGLYENGAQGVLEIIQNVDEEHQILMVVGHQPTWSELIAELTGGSRVRFPTAALARIDFSPDSWRRIEPATGSMIWLVTPRILQKLDGMG